ncbi:MAG: A24 family peptidase [archaeon]|jgi:Flp pilus assembly protein protease CpaA
MIIIIQEIILFIGTLLSAYYDTKTGYIFDWITYPMLVLGLILAIISSSFFNLISACAIFVILLITYKFGKIGGGDVKLFTAIALLNPFNELSFLITLFFIATISAMLFYSIYYFIKYAKIGIKWEREKNNILNAGFLAIAIIAYFFVLSGYGVVNNLFLIFIGIPLLIGLVFVALQKGIKIEFFEEEIKIKDLEEDEVIGENNSEKIQKILNGKVLLGEKEIAFLKKNKIHSIFVLRNLPKFGPFIFIGAILAIILPNFLMIILL